MEEQDTDYYTDIYINLTNLYSKEINYRTNNPYFKYERILSYYALLLMIIGTICNLISFIIMNRKHMRKIACMRYLSALSISDVLILYQWNLNTFFKYNFSKPPFYLDLEELTLTTCRLIAFLAFFSLQTSSWLLSIVSFDRLMLVYSTKWKHYMHKPIRIKLVIFTIVSIIFLLNIHLLFLNGYIIENKLNFSANILQKPIETKTVLSGELVLKSNTTTFVYIPKNEIVCYRSLKDKNYIFPKWEKAHLFLYTIFPFSVMLVSNSLIIYNVKYGQKVESQVKASVKRRKRMTFVLVLVTFTFIILTLPSVIVHTFFREYLKKKTYRRLVNLIVNNLLHTSHAINFFLYVFSAPNFRAEIFKILSNLWFRKSKGTNTSQKGNYTKTNTRNEISNTHETIHSSFNNNNNNNNIEVEKLVDYNDIKQRDANTNESSEENVNRRKQIQFNV